MRRMNSMLLGHQGASGAPTACISRWPAAWRDRPRTAAGARCGWAPPCRRWPATARSASIQHVQQALGAAPVVEVHLQRADAGRQIDDAGLPCAPLQRAHQRVHAEAQVDVEHQRAVLDQQVLVAGLAITPRRRARARAAGARLRSARSASGCFDGRAATAHAQRVQRVLGRRFALARPVLADAAKRTRSPGAAGRASTARPAMHVTRDTRSRRGWARPARGSRACRR
jgi:hypothetical protein